ncbi:MAG: ferrochelatase 2 [Gemmatimonadota bacterium]|nr:MAG: ferrochelatase 2 [Gemmatimonadota bacterium]
MPPEYTIERNHDHAEVPAIGVLFANLGTPDAPTRPALKRYLKEFLWDPRVVELPRWKWWLILNGIILNTRPRNSAKLYEKVWTEEGSPLLFITKRQAAAVESALRAQIGNPVHVAVGMRYGNPSIDAGLEELRGKQCRRILIFPAYPQYSAVTTGSTFDAVADSLKLWRWVPGLRMVHHYHDHPGYISALANSIRETWKDGGPPDRLFFSFHGMPLRYLENGDPYHCECLKTARLVAESLQLADGAWQVTFQSLFGKEEWLRPYTDETLERYAQDKPGASVDVLCPGFSADCLETIDEIGRENRHVFEGAGGGRYRFIPCLNDAPEHTAALADVALLEMAGWCTPAAEWNPDAVRSESEARCQRARAAGSAR